MSNSASHSPSRAVAIWLAVVLAMIAGIVLVGGMTRLTNSGLSITEWKPISGVIPPLSEADWQAELANYRGTTQYQTVNAGMSLEDFKGIYWWEWGHRMLARTIGLVVLFPLLWFWWRGTLRGPDARRGAILFGLICFQGLIGWLMVVSGLVGRTEVSQYRLAAHLGVAFAIFSWTLWMLLDIARHRQAKREGRGDGLALLFLIAVFCQVLFGALVAGLDAGLTYNTWPLMDGALVPNGLMADAPWWINFGENVAMVQFQHRVAAYVVALIALAVFAVSQKSRTAQGTASFILGVTLAQIGLGISTLLAGAGGVQPVALGVMHQLGALALVAAAVAHLHALSGTTRRARETAARPMRVTG